MPAESELSTGDPPAALAQVRVCTPFEEVYPLLQNAEQLYPKETASQVWPMLLSEIVKLQVTGSHSAAEEAVLAAPSLLHVKAASEPVYPSAHCCWHVSPVFRFVQFAIVRSLSAGKPDVHTSASQVGSDPNSETEEELAFQLQLHCCAAPDVSL